MRAAPRYMPDGNGRPLFHPDRVASMLARLARLKDEYAQAEKFGWGEGILSQIRSDIAGQERALEMAKRMAELAASK